MYSQNSIHENQTGTEMKVTYTFRKLNQELNRKPKNHQQKITSMCHKYTYNPSIKMIEEIFENQPMPRQ